ncbi:MAG TPA: YaiO family outer membrane beta-barrel protein [Rhodocyclaceae bacterium]|nr:YaiO family outer membrane beta-barrel protein [Rhodocyclaceae bacterium]
MQSDFPLWRSLMLAAALCSGHAGAQVKTPVNIAPSNLTLISQTAEPSSGYIEAGLLHHSLSAGYPAWQGVFLRAGWRSDPDNFWSAELVKSQEFGDQGTLAVLGNTHTINERWYTNVSVSGSSGGFYLPTLRMDVSANRKWLERLNLVTTVGLTAINARDGHEDRSLLLAASYYFEAPFVLEGGIRFNNSNPGQVKSTSQYVALTYGEHRKQILSLRYGFGEEAYQYIGVDAPLINFNSNVWTGTWRKWINPRQGFQVRAESYHNPYYNRMGMELSVFQEF